MDIASLLPISDYRNQVWLLVLPAKSCTSKTDRPSHASAECINESYVSHVQDFAKRARLTKLDIFCNSNVFQQDYGNRTNCVTAISFLDKNYAFGIEEPILFVMSDDIALR